jgi:hypothetical protein
MTHSEESPHPELGEHKQTPSAECVLPIESSAEPWSLPLQAQVAPIGGEMLAGELWQKVGSPKSLAGRPSLSIRIPTTRESMECGHCGRTFEIGGPTGFEAEKPICDPCLLEGSPLLGVLMALAAITRTYGAFRSEKSEELRLALMDYGAFARIYEHINAKEGAARPFFLDGIPEEGAQG